MPTYEYRCAKCGEHLEVYQSFSDAPLKRHKGCGGKLDKVFGSVGIVLKGSGFYRTDNRSSSGGAKRDRTESATGDTSSASGNGSSSNGDSKATKKADGAGTTAKSA